MSERLPKRSATYEDLKAVPEPFVAELVDGELYQSPRPASRHARATSLLGSRLVHAFDDGLGGPGGWYIVAEPELHLSADVLVPDLAGWRRERMPVYPDVPFFELPPDWICEVLSPSTSRLDRLRKLPLYAAAGIPYLWLLDPKPGTLEVYVLQGSHWLLQTTVGGEGPIRATPFEALQLDLDGVFEPPADEGPAR